MRPLNYSATPYALSRNRAAGKLLWAAVFSLFSSASAVHSQAIDIIDSACNTRDGFLSTRVDLTSKINIEDDDGHGMPDPLYFDSWAGVWVDPVSGLLVNDGTDFGVTTDTETGAQFYKPRGLWVDPKTLQPKRLKRLNKFPYYDPDTHETISPETGERHPYVDSLRTIGQNRRAAHRVRYACLGDNLKMRIDPATGRYLESADGTPRDDTLFDTLNVMIDGHRIPTLTDDRYAPIGFVAYMQYDTEILRDNLGLNNGISRADAMNIIYQKFAPESPESGTYDLREARVDDGFITQITARGLMDDAVSAVQILLFFDTSMKGRERLMNVGVRQKCGRSHSTQAWTRDRC